MKKKENINKPGQQSSQTVLFYLYISLALLKKRLFSGFLKSTKGYLIMEGWGK